MAKGYICISKSLTAAPVFFVKKKDGTLRLVQDYRALNPVTKKNKFPIPRISDLIDRLSKASIFTSLDLRWGYNNIRIRAGDEEKAAFITHRGLFEPTVMYFGFCNAPSTFQTMMNYLLRDLINHNVVVVYMDDILVFTKIKKEHDHVIKKVLKILKDNDLFLKESKCLWHQEWIEFLKMNISVEDIHMFKKKVNAILSWP